MKNSILIILCAMLLALACKKSQAQSDNKASEQSAAMYACPMHPEMTGKKGDKCSKCGMDMTEMKGMTHACPMHPEMTGKKGDKCSKCGMDMTKSLK